MILILSQDLFEITTEDVQDWIEYLGGDCLRLNGEDLTAKDEPYAMGFGSHSEEMTFELGGRRFNASEVGAVWWRRWHTFRTFEYLESREAMKLGRDIRSHLAGEVQAISNGLQVQLRNAKWLTRMDQRSVNKLEVLSRAAEVGLEIPATLVTNDKRRLKAFRTRNGNRIIVKPAHQATKFIVENQIFGMYTSEVSDAAIERAPERFFPTLAQAMIPKEFEVRTFYLNGDCWSMAIFSQADSKTQLDFRQYNFEKPNRNVPYKLPAEVLERVRSLVSALDLPTCSIDLIRTPDGRHVFLEVNPVGQFAMVSDPCNYHLEKKVAEHLLALEKRNEETKRSAPGTKATRGDAEEAA